jgi:hypothetical protein
MPPQRRSALLLALLVTGLAGGVLVEPVAAAPVITVRGRPRLNVETRRTARGFLVAGQVIDQDRQEPLARRPLELLVDGVVPLAARGLVTDGEGRFSLTLALPFGQHRIDVRFAGGGPGAYAPAARELELDVAKDRLDLTLEGPSRLRLGPGGDDEATFVVSASAYGVPRAVTVTLQTAPSGGRPSRPLATADTGVHGRAELTLPVRQLGGAGTLRLVARFAGDEQWNPVDAELALDLLAITRLDVRVSHRELTADGRATVMARALDLQELTVQPPAPNGVAAFKQAPRGTFPVAGGTVTLRAQGRPLASALTDASGAARLTLSAEDFSPGVARLTVELNPAEAWRRPARSREFGVVILAPRPVPIGYLVGPPLLTLLVMSAWSLRGRASGWLQRRAPRRPPEEKRLRGGLVPGPVTARTGGAQGRGRVRDRLGLTGWVIDADTGEAVAEAEVRLESVTAAAAAAGAGAVATPPLARTMAGPGGRYDLGQGTPGSYHLVARAPGYVAERVTVELPHAGELDDARLLLVPVRSRVREIYRRVAVRLLPRRELWGYWTARELGQHVQHQTPPAHPPLVPLGQLFEHVYYGQGPAEESVIREAEQLSSHLESALAPQAGAEASPTDDDAGDPGTP